MTTIKIHNANTGEVIERDMTADELAQYEADQIALEAQVLAKVEAHKAKAALLAKLGITEEEARLLLGGN